MNVEQCLQHTTNFCLQNKSIRDKFIFRIQSTEEELSSPYSERKSHYVAQFSENANVNRSLQLNSKLVLVYPKFTIISGRKSRKFWQSAYESMKSTKCEFSIALNNNPSAPYTKTQHDPTGHLWRVNNLLHLDPVSHSFLVTLSYLI